MTADTLIFSVESISYLVSNGFRDWDKYGMVNVVYHDGLVLFNYNGECNAKPPMLWNEFEKMSRGLILDAQTGDVVAIPFRKFWNYEPSQQSSTYVSELTVKMDGSLGIIYHWNNDWHVATRGSFFSDQALWANEFLHNNINLSMMNPRYTYLAEIIYPENRIVVDYHGAEDLVMIGARYNKYPYDDLSYSQYCMLGQSAGFTVVESYEVRSIADVIAAVSNLEQNSEGFVAKLSDGTRIKFKTDEYFRIHKFVSAFSFKHVVEAVQSGEVGALLELCPDNFKQLLSQYMKDIHSNVENLERELARALNACDSYAVEGTFDSKAYNKKFAEIALRDYKPYSKFLFMLRDGKDTKDEIYKWIVDNYEESKEAEDN